VLSKEDVVFMATPVVTHHLLLSCCWLHNRSGIQVVKAWSKIPFLVYIQSNLKQLRKKLDQLNKIESK